jgi:hypothetical protein
MWLLDKARASSSEQQPWRSNEFWLQYLFEYKAPHNYSFYAEVVLNWLIWCVCKDFKTHEVF